MTHREWCLTTVCTLLIFGAGSFVAFQPVDRDRPPLIAAASAEDVMRLVRDGKRVVFVDAREPAEFREERIPGAINLTLRQVQSMDVAELGQPDLVIAYCIKDFRGYEVAKALDRAGVDNVHVLAEVGIQGWKRLGLPTETGPPRLGAVASQAIAVCAAAIDSCIRTPEA
jgi:rhodanese-related sulfurtransferase